MSYQLQAPSALSPGKEPSLPIGQEAGMRQILWSSCCLRHVVSRCRLGHVVSRCRLGHVVSRCCLGHVVITCL